MSSPTIVVLSDTHSMHDEIIVPDGDILIHAGDSTRMGGLQEVIDIDTFLGSLPHKHKIMIAGNHDFCFEKIPKQARKAVKHAIYLEDSAVEVEGIKIFGSPWTPWFFDWAFNAMRGPEIRKKWEKIPEDTDILVTHGPVFGILDKTAKGEHVGCEELKKAVDRIQPKYHICGHIHEDYGVVEHEHTTFINGSNCTLSYKPTQKPIVFTF